MLRHRQLSLVVLGNLVSQLGTWSQYVGVGWAANRLSDSTIVLGIAFAAPWTASLFLSPIAGVLADRYDRRMQVIAGNVAMAVPPLVLGLMLQRGTATVAWLVALVFAGGMAQAMTQPASMALVPELVPDDEVQQAIALNSGLLNVTRIVGPGIGGFAISTWGIDWAFHLNAISFAGVVLAWLFVRVPPLPAQIAEGFVDRLRGGITYARSNVAVGRLILLAAVMGFFVMHAPLMPIFAEEVLDGDAGTYSLLSAAPGLGAFVGALVVGEIVTGRGRRRAATACALAMGVTLLGFAASRSVGLSVALLVCFGVAFFAINTLTTTVVTTATSPEYRGRVLGLLGTANLGLIPVNSVVAGLLAAWIGPTWTVAMASSGFALFATWFVVTGRMGAMEAVGEVSAVPPVDDVLLVTLPDAQPPKP